MSQVKISGNASGTGVLTIAAPNTNTDRSITLPDKAGAIAIGAGTIVQVVQATTSTQVAVSTTTFTDTTLTASITPSSSTNKVLIMIMQEFVNTRTATSVGMGIRLLRDTTTIWDPPQSATGPFMWYKSGGGTTSQELDGHAMVNYLDSPSTTSSVTYKTQGRPHTNANSGIVTFQSSSTVNPTSTIILMEVVA
jgi:hypothetical protein